MNLMLHLCFVLLTMCTVSFVSIAAIYLIGIVLLRCVLDIIKTLISTKRHKKKRAKDKK